MTETPPKPGYDALMHFVCLGRGFCGSVRGGEPLHVDMFIPEAGPVSADQFVEWVFLAENIDADAEPERWQRHKDAIRAAFVEQMGGEVADASKLRWSQCG